MKKIKKILITAILFAISSSMFAAELADKAIKIKPSIAAFTKYSLKDKAKRIAAEDSNLKLSVVKLAMKTYHNAHNLGIKPNKSIMTVIDYSLPSTKKRLWVVDINSEKILYSSLVAHGKNSGSNKYTTSFSNTVDSRKTSIGVFKTGRTYKGKHGYSLRMHGLEKGFNDNAKTRSIVIHGASYVNKNFVKKYNRTGRSWGCPAIEPVLTKPIINTIKDGTLIFSFYPDKNWLKYSRFINTQI